MIVIQHFHGYILFQIKYIFPSYIVTTMELLKQLRGLYVLDVWAVVSHVSSIRNLVEHAICLPANQIWTLAASKCITWKMYLHVKICWQSNKYYVHLMCEWKLGLIKGMQGWLSDYRFSFNDHFIGSYKYISKIFD